MRKLAIVLLITGLALPACAARRVTVDELEQAVAAAQGKLDGQAARQLGDLELTERLSTVRMERLTAELPGEKSKQALRALADESAFLAPPAAEIPATATPDVRAQRRMMAKTVHYLAKTLPMLPNLFASRDTTRFETRPGTDGGSADNPLRPSGRTAVTVLYRDGHELADMSSAKDKSPSLERGLATWGEFGPILGTVLMDAAHSRLAWSHWELSAGGPQGVFYYSVPREKSHYDVSFCCVVEQYGLEVNVMRQRTGYHGEMTIDPATGSIMRITVEADLPSGNPISRADIAVEYGPQEIGGKTYICPSRGIAVALGPDIRSLARALHPPTAGALPSLKQTSLDTIAQGPRQRLVNDIAFREFHLLRVDTRVIVGEEAKFVTAIAAADAPLAVAQATPVPDFANARPAEEIAAENMKAIAAAGIKAGSAPAEDADDADAAEPDGTPGGEVPEIMVSDATGLPKKPALGQTGGPDSGATLRMNARLVDVNVVALDKKGRPIPNLKPEDFEIYDNGVKQNVRSFGQIGVAPAEPSGAPAGPAAPPPAFSNRPLNAAKAGAAETNTTILLLDSSNLSFMDLGNAKDQMHRFLLGLKGDEQAALYVMSGHGFKVLHEATTDHSLLDAALAKWRPSAGDVANAQDEEARNRQTMETVHSPEDLLSVNGNELITDPQAQQEALDPKLRDFGADPAGDALSTLATVARHLAAISGHKSLVWVTSDNVLADWNEGSITINKNSKSIAGFVLRAQEAMNNAHVSVYPLDASQLEAGGVDASIGTRNVELNPTCTQCQAPQLAGLGAGPEAGAGGDITAGVIAGRNARTLGAGRIAAQMQQDLHSIQGEFREVADATGGQVFRRASDITSELNSVIADSHATYLLGFSPSQQADGTYHLLSVKLATPRKDVRLRFRTGYQYDKEPDTMKDRFTQAVWQPVDISEIAVTANPVTAARESTLRLNIAANDVSLAQRGDLWADKLDIFLVQRDDANLHAQVTGQTMRLNLKNETYQKLLREGIPYDQVLDARPAGAGSVRIVVVDENSGRMGSVTVPAAAVGAKQ